MCWGFIIWMPVHICGLWCLHYPFRLSSHSRSLTAPNSTNSCSNAPLKIMLDIFLLFVRKIFTQNWETSPDGSLEKIRICVSWEILLAGRRCRMLNNRGWMIPVTTLSPKLSLPICWPAPNSTIHSCLSYTSPIRQFLCVTHRLYRFREFTIPGSRSLQYI